MLFKRAHYFHFFEESITEVLKGQIIIDVGTDMPFRKELSRFQKLCQGCYYTFDFPFGHSRNQPDIYGDAHLLPFKSESIDSIICKDVIEHVQHPEKVIGELYRCLKYGGKAFVTLPFFTPYHGSELRNVCIEKGYLDKDTLTGHTTEQSMLNMSHLTPEEIDGLMRTFCMYVKFPKNWWQYIEKAEKFTEKGNKIFNTLNNIYHDIYFSKDQDSRSEEEVDWRELEETVLKKEITV